MRHLNKVSYHFHGILSYHEFEKIKEEINLCGGMVIYKTIKENNTYCVIKTDDTDAYFDFVRNFKQTEYYELTKEYKEEQSDNEFFSAINNGNIQWTEDHLKALFTNPESLVQQKADEYWFLLIDLLNKDFIRIRAEEYPHFSKPEEFGEERIAYDYCYNERGETVKNYLSWCAWNWLRNKGEKNPSFKKLNETISSPSLKIYVKVGDGNPYKIIFDILAKRAKTYIHIPYRPIHTLYIFEATVNFHLWLAEHKHNEILDNSTITNDEKSVANVSTNQPTSQENMHTEIKDDWTFEKDSVLITHVLDGLKNGKTYSDIFSSGIKEIGMNKDQCKHRWYSKWSQKYKHETVNENTATQVKQNPNKWNPEKESLLYTAILAGTKEGRTLKAITAQISKKIGVTPSACQSYWNNHAPKQYKEEFNQIKLDQEKNWSNEDMRLLNHMIKVEYPDLEPYEVFPIASERLKVHIDIIRKKWYELLKIKRIQG
ncbi:hypothetical protein [Neobacillus niacini]|uniref:hypothetical protein n=1 Tax=Neobacillus niacini TaxID=86668 RepID=UPI00203C75F7|nr:hypothetical protein [Neobacillus niacini]MCM3691489.1 hypothetical protein [Neobacillus niacini]